MKRIILPFFVMVFAYLQAFAAPRTLEVWIMPNGANPQGILEERMLQFQKETGIAAKVVVLDWGEAWSRINGALASGEGPDVVQLGTTWVSYMASKGYLAPLNDHLGAIDPSRFVPTSWNTAMVDGDTSVYAVPWFVDVRVLLGNQRLLDSMNVRASDLVDYRGFVKVLRQLRQANLAYADGTPISPFGFPGKSDWNIPHNFAPWIWSENGDFVRKVDGKWRSALLEPQTIVGIHKYLKFVLDTLINPMTLRDNTAQVAQRFNNGEQVFVLNTSETIMQTRISENEGGLLGARIGQDGVVAFPVPAGSGGSVSFVGGSNLALPKAKANDADALRLLLFLTRPDNLDLYTRKIGFLPPDRNVQQVWAQDEGYQVMVTAASQGRAYPNIPVWGDIESVLIEMFGTIWSMMDVGGLYSDEALYRTLLQYDSKVNDVLGVVGGQVPTLESFQKILASTDAEVAPVNVVEKPVPLAQEKSWSLTQKLTLVVVILLLVAAALLSGLRRKD